MNSPAIRIEAVALRKQFGHIVALDGLELSIGDDWKSIGILGRNGAGKTTFLRMLVGLLGGDGGRLLVRRDGVDYSHADPRLATYISEQITLVPTISGWRHLRLMEDLNRLSGVGFDRDLCENLIERFALREHLDKLIARMSKGNRRKLELVSALSAEVPLVIADELTEGLDIPSRISLESVIRELAAGGTRRFILSSHDLSFITGVADTLFIIDRGRCVDTFGVGVGTAIVKERVAQAFETLPGATSSPDPSPDSTTESDPSPEDDVDPSAGPGATPGGGNGTDRPAQTRAVGGGAGAGAEAEAGAASARAAVCRTAPALRPRLRHVWLYAGVRAAALARAAAENKALSLAVAIAGVLLYAVCMSRVVPPTVRSIDEQIQILNAHVGRSGVVAMAAMLQVFYHLFIAPPLISQIYSTLLGSEVLHVIHQDQRNPGLLSWLLLADAAALWLVVEALLFPVLWAPFLGHLLAGDVLRLLLLKATLVGACTATGGLGMAAALWLRSSRHVLLVTWAAALAYYAGVWGLLYMVYQSLQHLSERGLAVILARMIFGAVRGKDDLTVIACALGIWCMAIFNSGPVLAGTIRRLGVSYARE